MPGTEDAIVVSNVSKSFKLPHEQHNGLKQLIVNFWKRKKGYETQQVLNDISFEIKKGEFFGIVGRNGSGKSTLLKLLSGIYTPDKGHIQINGSLTPFIELGVGFNHELTGRENVYMNGALLGFSNKQMDAMYDDIVEFAELGRFMDQKLKNYSSGMQVRLAFSIAIKADSDILVLDEVLAVGDEAFQRKCYEYFAKLKKEKKTVILVTHSMDSVQQFCDKAMMIEAGEIIDNGSTADVAQHYRELFISKEVVGKRVNNTTVSNKDVSVKADFNNKSTHLVFDLSILPQISIEDPVIAVTINNDRGELVYRWVSDEKISESISLKKDTRSGLKLEVQNIFPNGVFNVNVAIKKRDRTLNYAAFREIVVFEIVNPGKHVGDVYWKPEETYEQK